MDKKIVFETEFDPENLRFVMLTDDGFKLVFYETGAWAHSSNKTFPNPSRAVKYARAVIERYKSKIAVAELEFILNDENSELEPAYLELIRNADVKGGEDAMG